MSSGVERMILDSEKEETRFAVLQEIFEKQGGQGSVKDFLVMGATDPDDGEEKHWGTMSEDEQKLWCGLHATGLTIMPLPHLTENPFQED